MIDGISSMTMPPPPPRGQGAASLSEEQKELISETLSDFDADNLTASDASTIVSIFQEAGIQPGAELAEAMGSAGFDARTVGDLAGVQGPPPGAGAGQNSDFNVSEDALVELYDLLEQYYAEETSEADKNTLLGSIEALLGEESSIFSASA